MKYLPMALLVMLGMSAAEPPEKLQAVNSPLSPQEALKRFRLDPGLKIELVASEPQIESPVAMAFDENGRLWVVEMRDYPNGPGKGQPPQGRIRLLEDRDGDGFYERSTVFADRLLFANGVLPWKGGLLVTAAPYIIYLRDAKGTGRADTREVLFEGFATKNPQLRVSHPLLGIDNWIYVVNGFYGGEVKRTGRPEQAPINISGMDFRFDLAGERPDEAISGMGQYGNTFDDWGRRFVCDNRHHLRHVVFESRYLKRNPYLAVPSVVEDISELGDGPLGSGGKIYPISKNWTTSSLHAGRFTAACGVFVYRGNLLPDDYRGSAFTCDPTGNLVHQEILKPRGATFHSRPARKGVEFLASADDWFRPVFLTSGPDGAMYVVDMYRAVIEHPDYMPPELQNRPDLTRGKDKGRIWRIVPKDGAAVAKRPNLSQASTERLVALLENPDAWWRTTAQRLLLERQDRAAIPHLQKMVKDSKDGLAAVHAAWLLNQWAAMNDDLLLRLLSDSRPEVRVHGVRLAEPRLTKSRALQEALLERARDSDGRVRYQVALTLGEWDDPKVLPALAHIAQAGVEDRWTRLAVASAVPKRAGSLLALLMTDGLPRQPSISALALVYELTTLVGARRDEQEVEKILAPFLALEEQGKGRWLLAGLNGLADGLARRGTRLGDFILTLPSVRKATDPKKVPFMKWFRLARLRAADVSRDSRRDLGERAEAVRFLGHASWTDADGVLASLLGPEFPQEIRVAAIRALSAHDQPEVPKVLMKSWRSYTPALRREVLEALLRQPARVQFLLDEVQKKSIKPGDIDALFTRQLINHSKAEIRDRARKLLQENVPGDRKAVVARYQQALKLKGDAKRGLEIFQKNCAICHRIAGIGVDVGPDIGDTRTKTPAALLVDILNPNQAIDNNAVSYVIVTKSGKVWNGIIAAETASSITLKWQNAESAVILRQDIEEIQSSGVSFMPEGFERQITIPQMADLISFLKNWRYLDGAVPLEK
jgi:putative membrane-bound dehydrogenase-like protein